jgi:hypothetical protein
VRLPAVEPIAEFTHEAHRARPELPTVVGAETNPFAADATELDVAPTVAAPEANALGVAATQNAAPWAEANALEVAATQNAGAMAPAAAHDEAPPASVDATLAAAAAPARSGTAPLVQSFVRAGGAFGRGMFSACAWVDDRVHRVRGAVLLGLAVLSGVVTPLFDGGAAAGKATTLATLLLLYAAWTFGFAFVGSLSDEAGGWSGRAVFDWVRAHAIDVRERSATLREVSRSVTFRRVGTGLLALGALVLGGVSVIALSRTLGGGSSGSGSLLTVARSGGALLCALGAVGYALSRRFRRDLVAQFVGDPERVIGEFEPVLDLTGSSRVFAGRDLVQRLLAALAQWRPRHWHDTLQYRLALGRHLERRLGDVSIARNERLGARRAEAVADLVVAGRVVVQVERSLRTRARVERALGRMRTLARSGNAKPTLLVLFETTQEDLAPGSVRAELADLHRHVPCVTVRMPVAEAPLE